jgi:hypothetical protein
MPVAWAVGACGGPSGRAEERRSGLGDLGPPNRAGEAGRKESREARRIDLVVRRDRCRSTTPIEAALRIFPHFSRYVGPRARSDDSGGSKSWISSRNSLCRCTTLFNGIACLSQNARIHSSSSGCISAPRMIAVGFGIST